MRVIPRHSVRAALGIVMLLGVGALPVGAEQSSIGSVIVESSDTSQQHAAFTTCESTVQVLQTRGWELAPARIRVQENPYDATTPTADIVVGAQTPAEDIIFAVAEGLVQRRLEADTSRDRAALLAGFVAAHLSPRGSRSREMWEREWVARLAAGDLLTTAIPELLWRRGSDAAIRQLATVTWPDGALSLLPRWGVSDAVNEVGEVALAGLLHPEALGFAAVSPLRWTRHLPASSTELSLEGPQLQVLALPTRASAESVLLVRGDEARAWTAVRYLVPDSFDVVALSCGNEVAVPLQGTVWAGVIAVNLSGSARLSLAVRPLPDFPVEVSRWDFSATEGSASIAWETARHRDLSAYVVEGLARGEGGRGWRSIKRVLIPVASQNGDEALGYSFVDDDIREVAAYRLLALTSEGFLAEVGVFPVAPRR